ncbi:MAG TPA: glutamate-cysteine ligase family protein [Blastocatellia bacterium]|nr:glutamate-cysteine ligase family protein [Blastocatellia bacterium]
MSPEPITSSIPLGATDPISATSDFARVFTEGGKPASRWAVGAEVELFGFTRDTLERISPAQVQQIINGFADQTISRVTENGYVTEAVLRRDESGRMKDEIRLNSNSSLVPTPSSFVARLTLEPGGQIEYSGAHHRSLVDVERGLRNYLARLGEIAEANGIIMIAAGFDPLRGIEEQRWIPKRRYEIMRPYLGARGRRAWDMMCRTAAIQANLDYSDAEDLAKKFLLATRLGPVAAAIFANSPFDCGRLSGYKSTRYAAWLETDADRTGPSPVALEDDFSIERFIDYVHSVPMIFIRRGGAYIDMAGRSFAKFVTNGVLHKPILQDFTDHLTTIFTEARLRPHIEQRSMDCGRVEMVMAAMAFWKGLMYNRSTLESALKIAPKLNRDEYARLQLEVARHALGAKVDGTSVIDLAIEAISLARTGLKRIAPDEAQYFDVLAEQVIKENVSPADILIRNFDGSWHGDIRKVVERLRVS